MVRTKIPQVPTLPSTGTFCRKVAYTCQGLPDVPAGILHVLPEMSASEGCISCCVITHWATTHVTMSAGPSNFCHSGNNKT